jgi:hypothetical protein
MLVLVTVLVPVLVPETKTEGIGIIIEGMSTTHAHEGSIKYHTYL